MVSGRRGPCPGCLLTWTVKAGGSTGSRTNGKPTLTSAGMLATAGMIPFSVLTFPELLLGELGAEPGALLHAESVGRRDICELRSVQRSRGRQQHVLSWAREAGGSPRDSCFQLADWQKLHHERT